MKITNLSDTEFKALVIKMLRGLIEYSHKIKEEMKDALSEIKIYSEPTVNGKKPELKSTIWNKINKYSTRTE